MKTIRTYILPICLLAVLPAASFAQETYNFVQTYKALEPIQSDLSVIDDKERVQETTTYFDGLGREIQSAIRQGSPLGYDIVSVSSYDQYGRKNKNYLPYVSQTTDGQFKSDAFSDQTSFYESQFGAAEKLHAVSITILEISALGRVLKKGAPGSAWQPTSGLSDFSDKTVKIEYTTNLTEEVLLWKFDPVTKTVSAQTDGTWQYYTMNELHVTRTYDEHNALVIEYKDKAGRVVLKRVQISQNQTPIDHTNFASTYYIYDDRGNLFTVLPPEAVKALTD